MGKNPTYCIGNDGYPYIKCLVCGKKSYHPTDIERLFCVKCNKFHPISAQGDEEVSEVITHPEAGLSMEPEFCEHKFLGVHYTRTGDRYITQCGDSFVEHKSSLRSEFCPYCGKKIKEVGDADRKTKK